MKDIFNVIIMFLITLGVAVFIFTSNSSFESLSICILYIIFMEVKFPDKDK